MAPRCALPLVTAALLAAGAAAVALLGAPPAAGAADPPVTTACAGTVMGSVFTLTADCDTTAPLTVPDGFTVDGAGHTITAHDPAGGNFDGGVLTNAAGGASMIVRNLTIRGTGFATLCSVRPIGVWFSNASGSVENVRVEDITQHSGCPNGGFGIRTDALVGTPRTVTITGTTVSGYQRGGLITFGLTTLNVTGSTIGPPDQLPAGTLAQNGVQYNGGPGANGMPGGTITSSTIFGSGFGSSTATSTAVLLFTANQVTLTGNTIAGAGTDIGVSVSAASSNILIQNNQIGRTSPDAPDTVGTGVDVTADSAAGTRLVCNTFSNWKTETSGVSQPPCIATASLPSGRVGTPYSTTLTATGGTAPYRWSLQSGRLPPGLSLSRTGAITGTPTMAGTYTFTADVTDATGAISSHAFTITIRAAPTPTPTPSQSTATVTNIPTGSPSPIGTGLAATGGDRTAPAILGVLLLGAGIALNRTARNRRRT